MPDRDDIISKHNQGWITLSDNNRSISVGIRHFLKEYPKEISIIPDNNEVTAYSWSPSSDPMHFARTNSNPDRGQVGNFATGLTKTSELVYHFEDINKQDSTQEIINSFLFPNVAHAESDWYS